MSGTHDIVMGNRGRIVVPSGVRERSGLSEGTRLVLFESPLGLVLMTREQLRERVRSELAGVDLLESLLQDRRRAAEQDDAA